MSGPHFTGASVAFLAGTAYEIVDVITSHKLRNDVTDKTCSILAKTLISVVSVAALISSILLKAKW